MTASSNNAHSNKWRVVDIVVASIIAVASGVIFWGWDIVCVAPLTVLEAVTPGFEGLVNGFWLFGGPLAAIIVRKPGAAIYVNLVGSAAEMLLGNQFSVGFVFAAAALQGLFAEIPFMVTRYRVYNLPISMVSGALVALEYGVYLMLFRYQGVAFLSARGIVHMVSELVGGVLIAGVMSWYLYRAIALTGALDRFASGRAVRGGE